MQPGGPRALRRISFVAVVKTAEFRRGDEYPETAHTLRIPKAEVTSQCTSQSPADLTSAQTIMQPRTPRGSPR